MTLTTKTRISNRKQIWRHNSWWNLLGKLPMEWVTCLQNLWVEEKKNKKTISSQSLITIYPFKAYRLGRIIFWYNVIFLNDYAWEVRTFSQRLQGNSSILTLSSIFFFLKLGSAIVGHRCRLPYPRLKLFSFPLIIFGCRFSFTTSKMI